MVLSRAARLDEVSLGCSVLCFVLTAKHLLLVPGAVVEKQSPWRLSIIADFFAAFLNFIIIL